MNSLFEASEENGGGGESVKYYRTIMLVVVIYINFSLETAAGPPFEAATGTYETLAFHK
jgi:hypothetical protein